MNINVCTDKAIYDFKQFNTPCLTIMSGPSGSGKTTLLFGILQNLKNLFTTPPNQIYFVYNEWQDMYEKLSTAMPQIQFIQELNEQLYNQFNKENPTLLIADDFQQDVGKNKLVAKLAIQGVRHRNVTLFLILQNFYFGSDVESLNIRRSTNYFILMKSVQDLSVIKRFAYQIYMEKASKFMQIYHQAVSSKPYGYLMIDCTVDGYECLRLRTDILAKYPAFYEHI